MSITIKVEVEKPVQITVHGTAKMVDLVRVAGTAEPIPVQVQMKALPVRGQLPPETVQHLEAMRDLEQRFSESDQRQLGDWARELDRTILGG